MWKVRFVALLLFIAGAGVGYFVYDSETNPDSRFPFHLGLDLSGGTHLVYNADLSEIPEGEKEDALASLRDVIERRVNLFGVAEPIVQVEKGSVLVGNADESRLIVELPGVTDVDAAVALIGQTPLLEFKVERPDGETQAIIEAQGLGERLNEDPYQNTELTGRFLERAQLEFQSATGNIGLGGSGGGLQEPVVALEFNDRGAELFAEMTSENVGKTIAIYLDGFPISTPVVQEEITAGRAQISGNFTAEEAKELVGRLNSGALPVPITLLTTQTIGPSLGAAATQQGVQAGIVGLMIVALFLLVWYRIPGLIAVVSLSMYIAIMLAIFKIIPVTLTAAGIAGFILSIGMAVDANVLIFERMKEELRKDNRLFRAIYYGFQRAWLSIRDANISSIITAVILFWFGTSLVEGFALTFGLGVLVSMLTAITVTRTFLYAISKAEAGKTARLLFSSGLGK